VAVKLPVCGYTLDRLIAGRALLAVWCPAIDRASHRGLRHDLGMTEPPLRWPSEEPDRSVHARVERRPGMTEEDVRRIAERRARHDAQDRVAPAGRTRSSDPGTPGLAIAAMVFAVLLPLVGFVLGIIGTATLGGPDRKGQGLSIAAIVVSVVLTPIYAVLLTS